MKDGSQRTFLQLCMSENEAEGQLTNKQANQTKRNKTPPRQRFVSKKQG